MGIPAGNGSRLCGYQTSFNKQQHVIFVGADKHVHELVYADHWYHNDLTKLATSPTAAPNAAPDTELVGYETAFNEQHHVIFLSADGHIHELVYADRWYHHDLTKLATVPSPAPVAMPGALAGYVTTLNNQQHVIFLGPDYHIRELVYGDRWSHYDLTYEATAPVATPHSALAGYETAFNSQQHVLFIAADHHVHQFVHISGPFGSSTWIDDDPSLKAKAPTVDGETALAGFQTAANKQQHVIFVGADKHVHELVFNHPKWYTDDLTTRVGAGDAMADRLVGLSYYDGNQSLLYVGAGDGHVHELYYLPKPNKWLHKDLTKDSNAVAPITGSPLVGYLTTYEDGKTGRYVVFLGPQNHVYELVGSSSLDLTESYY